MKRVWILCTAFGIMSSLVFAETQETPGGVVYDAHGKRDPFVALVSETTVVSEGLATVESPSDVKIEGIIYDAVNGSLVVINGTVLRQGEELNGVKLIEIKPDGVLVSVNGQEMFKEMHEEEQQA